MHISKVLDIISNHFSNSSPTSKDITSFGNKSPRHIDFSNIDEQEIGSFVTDLDGKVYEIIVEIPDSQTCYRWINPSIKDAYLKETEILFGDESQYAWDDVKYTDLDVEDDILTKLEAIFKKLPFDPDVLFPLDLDDETFIRLSKMAHERNITLNMMVVEILSKIIATHKLEDHQVKTPKKNVYSTF
ncbi:hypothetical protein GW796_06905 [archaeon]|nr:hypothetical protein [archaeon]